MTIETNRSPSTNSRAPPTSPFTNTGAPTHVWVTIFSSIFVFVRVEGWWGPNGKIPCYRNLPYKPSLDIAPMKFYKYVFSNSYKIMEIFSNIAIFHQEKTWPARTNSLPAGSLPRESPGHHTSPAVGILMQDTPVMPTTHIHHHYTPASH